MKNAKEQLHATIPHYFKANPKGKPPIPNEDICYKWQFRMPTTFQNLPPSIIKVTPSTQLTIYCPNTTYITNKLIMNPYPMNHHMILKYAHAHL